jgi:hypothetical protein
MRLAVRAVSARRIYFLCYFPVFVARLAESGALAGPVFVKQNSLPAAAKAWLAATHRERMNTASGGSLEGHRREFIGS